MDQAADIAQTLLNGFDRHYRLFREISAAAKQRFERGDWAAIRDAVAERNAYYDQRVVEAVEEVLRRFPLAGKDETIWTRVKQHYITLLYDHKQPECAETFYNSAACRVLHRRYYRNEYIFFRPAVSTEHLTGSTPTYRFYQPGPDGLGPAFRRVIEEFRLACPFEDLDRDIGYIDSAIREAFPQVREREGDIQLQVLSSLFFRDKAAYVVGRSTNGNVEHPFVIPILRNAEGQLYLDTICLTQETIGRVFSLARNYFMVDMEVPAGFVGFLRALIPSKRAAEFYIGLGLLRQGKTLLYRDLQEHLRHSTDKFEIAPGTRGMVMVVFSLPSFPFVFKLIRDWFAPPKDTDEKHVRDRYLFVKTHDRAGRMADTLEYSHVAFPRDRFSQALMDEMKKLAPSRFEIRGDRIIISHLWIERRLIPLDMYIREADDEHLEHAMIEYGNTVKELAAANIFPGDLLLKNFGVTRFGRVVFYDYDEMGYLTDCNFRRMPETNDDEDDTRASDWFSVGPDDVFPQQFPTFIVPAGRPRELFMKHHGDLADPLYWIETQARCRAAQPQDIFPYPRELRFRNRYATRPAA